MVCPPAPGSVVCIYGRFPKRHGREVVENAEWKGSVVCVYMRVRFYREREIYICTYYIHMVVSEPVLQLPALARRWRPRQMVGLPALERTTCLPWRWRQPRPCQIFFKPTNRRLACPGGNRRVHQARSHRVSRHRKLVGLSRLPPAGAHDSSCHEVGGYIRKGLSESLLGKKKKKKKNRWCAHPA